MTSERSRRRVVVYLAVLIVVLVLMVVILAQRYQAPANADLVALALRAIDDTLIVQEFGGAEVHIDRESLDRLPLSVRVSVLGRVKHRWPEALEWDTDVPRTGPIREMILRGAEFKPLIGPGRVLLLFEISGSKPTYRFDWYSVASDGRRDSRGVIGTFLHGQWREFSHRRVIISYHNGQRGGATEE